MRGKNILSHHTSLLQTSPYVIRLSVIVCLDLWLRMRAWTASLMQLNLMYPSRKMTSQKLSHWRLLNYSSNTSQKATNQDLPPREMHAIGKSNQLYLNICLRIPNCYCRARTSGELRLLELPLAMPSWAFVTALHIKLEASFTFLTG